MPRQLRIAYAGATYHVMSRGNRQQTILLDDVDRHPESESGTTLGVACQKTGWFRFGIGSHRMVLDFDPVGKDRGLTPATN